MGREIDLLANYPRTKRNLEDRARSKTEEDRRIARRFGQEFFDGDRRYGCGGFNYQARFWQPVVPALQAHFGLVGDDPVAAPFGTLSNVSIAKDDGIALERSLALIQAAGLFMGMMSGPANMALFGKKPYLIFKNPDHHALEMTEEIGTGDRYSFATERQRVLRIWDTTENLAGAFRFALGQIA